jgi:hypothetical protein
MDLKTKPPFLSSINWRLLLFHLIACLLFIVAARQFSLLHDLELTIAVNSANPTEAFGHLSGEGTLGERFSASTQWVAKAQLAGLVIAGFLSFLITLLKNVSWIYTVAVLVLSILISGTGALHSDYVASIFLFPGRLCEGWGVQYRFLVNGFLLTAFGLLLFIYKWSEFFFFKPQNELE